MIAKEAVEIAATETSGGDIFALVRPFRSPTMWETRSSDGGLSWLPLSRGEFPMCESLAQLNCYL